MRTPTSDQEAVLASPARIRLVRAAPGSGKTWMVAEVIRKELSVWAPGAGGVAALSFTRVGGDEIRRALGHAMPHPHVSSTIDAFLFRYVVRPHIRAVDSSARAPEIIVADWRPAEIWTSTTFGGERAINPYACVWIGRDDKQQPVLAHVMKNRVARLLRPGECTAVKKFKGDLLRHHGRISLSDSALYASFILRHPTIGPLVRAEVIRRFPLLIVDEMQDTGVFLAESVRALLGEPQARGLLVGDPDQAIYEFNGAAPAMFESFASLSGVESLELRTSRRCPSTVAAGASHLKQSGGPVLPADGAPGQALLVRYDNLPGDVAAIAAAYRRVQPAAIVKVVARGNATVDALTGRSGAEVLKLRCPAASLLHRGVRHFRCGRPVPALAAARAAIESVALGGEALTADQLRARGVPLEALKQAAIRCLLAANALPTTGTTLEWHHAARELAYGHACAFRASLDLAAPDAPPRPQKREGHATPVSRSIPSPGHAEAGLAGVPVLTVHGVKGETHDVTIFVVPRTKSGTSKCPSTQWWPAVGTDDEERRIAYVALTRTRGDLVVCVDEATNARLAETRPEFVAAFESLSVNELLGRMAEPAIEPAPQAAFASVVS